jgi:hypothetical protein
MHYPICTRFFVSTLQKLIFEVFNRLILISENFNNKQFSKYSGRKLQINPALGSADVKVTFFRSTVEKKTSPDGQQVFLNKTCQEAFF